MIKIAVAGEAGPGRNIGGRSQAAIEILQANGFDPCSVDDAEGLVWVAMFDPDGLAEALAGNPSIRWVQLPRTGVDNFLHVIRANPQIAFTCAKGAYAPEVAEHALMLTLTVMRRAVEQARVPSWHVIEAESLEGKRVTIVGGGFIAERLIELLSPFGCSVTIVRRTDTPVIGATRTVTQDSLMSVLPETDVLFLALSLTSQTNNLIGAPELAALPQGAYLINVARGQHVVEDALVDSIASGHLGGAGLDVTEPEPLSDTSRLWGFDNVLITSHSANSIAYITRRLAERVLDNARRLNDGRELVGVVDPITGY